MLLLKRNVHILENMKETECRGFVDYTCQSDIHSEGCEPFSPFYVRWLNKKQFKQNKFCISKL